MASGLLGFTQWVQHSRGEPRCPPRTRACRSRSTTRLTRLVTGRARFPLVIELFRQLGVAQTIDAEVAVKQRQRGLPPSQLVESLIVLWASGGDRCQDLTTLREDQPLAVLFGHPLPAAT